MTYKVLFMSKSAHFLSFYSPGHYHRRKSGRSWEKSLGEKISHLMNLEDITQSELRQSQKDKHCLIGRLQGMDFPGGSDGKASAYNAGDLGSIPGSGRSPGEGNGNPLQYSCLENPMDGAW